MCNDALKVPATGVPVPASLTLLGATPDSRDPGGGVQIRLVFDKVLDDSIETISPSGSTTPGLTNQYSLVPGLVELDDDAGKPVRQHHVLRQRRLAQYSADVELVPLGPAIVIKPTAPLAAATTYTIKLASAERAQGSRGPPPPSRSAAARCRRRSSFTTEALTPASGGAFPSDSRRRQRLRLSRLQRRRRRSIAPNEVLQVGFFEAFAGDSATVTVKSGCTGAKPIAYSERGADASMCTKADPGGYPVLDVVNSDSGSRRHRQAGRLADGRLHADPHRPGAAGNGAPYSADYSFTVSGAR